MATGHPVDGRMHWSLGAFEYEVLATLLAQPRDAYGVTLRRRLKEVTGREPSFGALYTTLERLERKGLVGSEWGEPTAVRGGRRKRYYRITGHGQCRLAEHRARLASLGTALGLTPKLMGAT